ncbi:hypothetical protein NE850_00150 [Paraburkholderia sp. USG1]|uniref:hypothetical protein n=1 Tax=Paraburkholderia sp. USG1 TaxID=2952268 RepID=UPI0028550B68|nr:hypothetical protein [Paraburkholderia sp. USG1]MDR8394738.1 hypothetical protein [Paraburkholderia sp. USG1]
MTHDNSSIRHLTYREWIEKHAQRGDEGAISQLHGWCYAEQRRRKHCHGCQTEPD